MRKAAIYLRVSTTDQDYSRQETELKAKLKANGDQYVATFEEKKSAVLSMDTREELTKLRNLPKGTIDIIYFWDVTRLSRRSLDFINLVNEFTEKGICLYFKDRDLYTLDAKGNKDSIADLYLYMLGMFAQMDAENLKAKMKSGKNQSLLKGNSYTGTAPYGYYIENKKLYIKEDEAELVRTIFSQYLEGKSLRKIGLYIDAMGIKPRMSDRWSVEMIRNIIRNPVYMGKPIYRDFKKVDGKRVVDRVRTFEAPVIIDPAQWELSQQKRKDNITCADKTRKVKSLLKGILKCGMCGKPYDITKSCNNRFYKCSDKRSSINVTVNCKNSGIRVSHIDYIIWELIKDMYKKDSITEKIAANKELKKKQIIENIELIENYGDSIKKISDTIKKIQKGYIVGIIDENTALKEINGLKNEQKRINKEINNLESDNYILNKQIEENVEQIVIDEDIDDIKKAHIVKKYIKEVRLYGIENYVTYAEVEYNFMNNYIEGVIIRTQHKYKSYSIIFDTESIIFDKQSKCFNVPFDNDAAIELKDYLNEKGEVNVMINGEKDSYIGIGAHSYTEIMKFVGINEFPEFDKNDYENNVM